MRLVDKYRPMNVADIIGHVQVIDRLRRLAHRAGLAGHSFWITGESGTGKTTLARLIAREVADSFSIAEVDATNLSPILFADELRSLSLYGVGGRGRALIINESHGLRKDVLRRLLVYLDDLPPHVVVCFTTTRDDEGLAEIADDMRPLLSRCVRLTLDEPDKLEYPFAIRCREIAKLEGLDGQPLSAYVTLAQNTGANFRAMLQAIELGELE